MSRGPPQIAIKGRVITERHHGWYRDAVNEKDIHSGGTITRYIWHDGANGDHWTRLRRGMRSLAA
jgi:hypothetical protein